MKKYKMWINSKWIEAKSGKTYPVYNPATGEEIAQVSLGDKTEVDLAVEAAKKAFPIWSKKPQAERSHLVAQIANQIREHSDELAKIDILDHGTPAHAAGFPNMVSANLIEFAAQSSRALMGQTVNIPDSLSYIQREPYGVCALITPWNLPLAMIALKLGSALAVGNTVVIKPPSIDSLSALKLAELIEKVDLPTGTVNVITGPGASVGEALASHPSVDKVGFIGSCETGKRIMACASATVKGVGLELGGKSPFIVLEDADIEAAVHGALWATFWNCGQICASPGRYYIHEKIHDEFVERFAAEVGKLVVGDPSDMKTQVGPLVSAEHRNKVESYIESGKAQGATLVIGGCRPKDAALKNGYFIMPTIFTNVTLNMKIAREEIFGPVACIMKFSTDNEVIASANDNVFGLAASIWTKNFARGIRMGNALQDGWVWINQHSACPEELPWGGFKESGLGKDQSFAGLEEYTRQKAVYIDLSENKNRNWGSL
jgi:acyl-CoA reductase-like NAD-dependent aldehyde dehydrogenase